MMFGVYFKLNRQTDSVISYSGKVFSCFSLLVSIYSWYSSELRPGLQGKMRFLHIYACLMLFPHTIKTKLLAQVDNGHKYLKDL